MLCVEHELNRKLVNARAVQWTRKRGANRKLQFSLQCNLNLMLVFFLFSVFNPLFLNLSLADPLNSLVSLHFYYLLYLRQYRVR